MSAIRDLAILEPLVDTVNADAVLTDHCKLWTCDIATVKKEDLTFECPFALVAQRNDFMHALVVYFDIEFSHCHKPIRFSTGPHARYTHWKQTVFYLSDELTVEKTESLTGVIRVRPNSKNHRDLDIEIAYKFAGSKGEPVERVQPYRLR
jgi:protein arginine N-methyltransferase 1